MFIIEIGEVHGDCGTQYYTGFHAASGRIFHTGNRNDARTFATREAAQEHQRDFDIGGVVTRK